MQKGSSICCFLFLFDFPAKGHEKRAAQPDDPYRLLSSANAVELNGQGTLLVSRVILVKNTLRNSLIDRLHCDLVSTLGLGAIAFSGSRLT